MQPHQNAHEIIVADLRTAIGDRLNRITESEMWEMIASRTSPEWIAAKHTLAASKKDFDARMEDDNVPLGAIGAALDGGDLDNAANIYTRDLANFTIVNENLRQQDDAKRILKTLMDSRVTAEKSLQLSLQTQKTTMKLETAVQPEKKSFRTPARDHFNRESRRVFSFKETLDLGIRNMTSHFLKQQEDTPVQTATAEKTAPAKKRIPAPGMAP